MVEASKFQFTLYGLTPLLLHADSVSAAEEVREWRLSPENRAAPAGDDRYPPWTWQSYVYSDGQHLALPQMNILAGLRVAGAQVRLQGRKSLRQLSQSAIVPDSDYAQLFIDGKKIPISLLEGFKHESFADQVRKARELGIELMAVRARVGQAKHVRVRPCIYKWQVQGTVTVYSRELTRDRMQQLFDLAGDAGLGDWRPSCRTPGPYGRFRAEVELLR